MSRPAISIVIPTLGNYQSLDRLLASIQRQKISGQSEIFEALVIVNGEKAVETNAEFQKLTASYGQFLKLSFMTETGVNRARNAGLRQAIAAIVLFLDDDCELPEPYFLARHIAFHHENTKVFATGGGYQLPLGAGRLDEVYNRVQMRWFVSGLVSNEITQCLLGGNFSIKSDLAKDRKLMFDEQIKYGGSESEFFKKAGLLKLELRANSFEVLHHTHETLLSLTRKLYKQGRGKALIDEKYPNTSLGAEAAAISHANDLLGLGFSYVFWCGYYFYHRNYFRILVHIFKDGIAALNTSRFRILNRIAKKLAEKKEKGDRF